MFRALQFFLFAILPAAAAERHALVIGNTHYPESGVLVTPLDNCIPDAELVAGVLEDLGFKVTPVMDASKSVMDDALLSWEESLPRGCEAVVYFAGHGIEHDGKNYLLGTNARLRARSRIGEEAMEAATFAQAMLQAGASSSFLFLDCCREAPPAEWVTRGIRKRGLADLKVDGDIIIAYAAKPGDAALDHPVITGFGIESGHGPYAQALVKFLRSGLKHTDFFQNVRLEVHRLTGGAQRTWENGSFLRDYYFNREGERSGEMNNPGVPIPRATEVDPFAGTRAGQEWENGMGTDFRWCPPGEFWMGSSAEEMKVFNRDGVDTSDETRHRVKLTRGFWMSENEVTQGEWEAVMGRSLTDQAQSMLEDDSLFYLGNQTLREYHGLDERASASDAVGMVSPSFPIYYVDFSEAAEYCEVLTRMERERGALSAGWKYALPTEAQWEYACRAGTETTLYHGGMTIEGRRDAPSLDEIAWYGGNSSVAYEWRGWFNDSWEEMQYPRGLAGPRRVGQKMPNRWGLTDMIGNVFEWCDSVYSRDITDQVVDPIGADFGASWVYRGGSWNAVAAACRPASRGRRAVSSYSTHYLGFRPVIVPFDEEEVSEAGERNRSIPTKGQQDWGTAEPGEVRSVLLPGGVELRLRFCPPGEFLMGSPVSERERDESEAQVAVEITSGFWLAETECTQAQWVSLEGQNPSKFVGTGFPVETVDWTDVQRWLERLNRLNVAQEGWMWALPNETQWEYACRAGSSGPFHFGGVLAGEQANVNGRVPYGTEVEGVYLGRTVTVGRYPANQWGLYDMHGNVSEWCSNWYSDRLIAGRDPVGPLEGNARVVRGGSWGWDAGFSRAAHRFARRPDFQFPDTGFRPALVRRGN